jgi:RNA polymerase sigma factor (sigma-70 family)
MNPESLDWRELWRALADDLESRRAKRRTVDLDASDELWTEAYRRVRTLAYVQPETQHLTVDDVEDLVQVVMLRLQNLERVREVAASGFPRAYLATMMRNLIVDRYRAGARRASAYETYKNAFTGSHDVPVSRLMELLGKLTTDERTLLYRRFWEGRTIAEIAEADKLPYSTVAKRIFRITGKLREGQARRGVL